MMKITQAVAVLAVVLAGPAVADGASGHDHAAHGNMSAAQHAASAPATAPSPTAAMTDGEVRKVDLAAQKVTLRHGRLENLDMDPMTMVFRVKDPAWLQTLKVGDKVRFAADRVAGALTVVALETAK